MLIPMLATRLLARNVLASSCRSFQRLPTLRITRTFSASSAVWARAAASEKSKTPKKTKPKARKTSPKKRPTRKAAKKTRLTTKKKARKVPAKRKKSIAKKIILRGRPDLKPPQKPGGPYLSFFRKYLAGQQRPEGASVLEFHGRLAKEASASWNALSEQEKQPFQDEYAVALAEYKKRFDEYLKKTDITVLREINRRRKKNGKRRLAGKKFTNGFVIFGSEQRAKLKRPESLEQGASILQEIAKNWQALATQEKLSYAKLARERNAALSQQ